MIRIKHLHLKIVYGTFCFKIIVLRMAEKISTRCSCTIEFKFKVVQFFDNHGKICNQTATHFKVNRKQVGILFTETLSFIILFILLLLFQILRAHIFLSNPSNSKFFAHTFDVIPFRSF